jgi:metal-responsive CopG/Arc/MetJ family transcriptional regulator
MAALTLTVRDDRLREVDEFARQEGRSREDIVDEAIDAYLRQKSVCLSVGQNKMEIVKSLFGIIPNDGRTLPELREERLARYESTD